eukprot:1238253-Rhodomonas_salina.1
MAIAHGQNKEQHRRLLYMTTRDWECVGGTGEAGGEGVDEHRSNYLGVGLVWQDCPEGFAWYY